MNFFRLHSTDPSTWLFHKASLHDQSMPIQMRGSVFSVISPKIVISHYFSNESVAEMYRPAKNNDYSGFMLIEIGQAACPISLKEKCCMVTNSPLMVHLVRNPIVY